MIACYIIFVNINMEHIRLRVFGFLAVVSQRALLR
jgi:hypothetical protein